MYSKYDQSLPISEKTTSIFVHGAIGKAGTACVRNEAINTEKPEVDSWWRVDGHFRGEASFRHFMMFR